MKSKIIFISPYPPKGTTYNNKFSALASFCKNTVESLRESDNESNILVLADIIPNGQSWKEKCLEIKRVWKRKSLNVYFSLLKEILKEKRVKIILIELEWSLLGDNPFIISLMPLFVLLLRSLGKKVLVVPHGIVLDFSSISQQLGLEKDCLKSKIYNFGIKLFYAGLVLFSNKIIVLEEYFEKLINQKFNLEKTVFIPHGVDKSIKIIPKRSAKQKLGISEKTFVISNFGFLSWYKGSDIMIRIFQDYIKKFPRKNIQLIMAGGPSFNHKKNKAYKSFVKSITKKIADNDKISITGFIPENKLSLYLSAADVFIFPYRLFLSSSGPLSLAFSLEKPFLLSKELEGYFESSDLKSCLEDVGLKKSDVLFKQNASDFSKKINWLMNRSNLEKLEQFSRLMKEKRSWEKISENYRFLNIKEEKKVGSYKGTWELRRKELKLNR